MKMSLTIQTKNPILRAWGNFCGHVADLFLDQSIKYGDMYEVEGFLDRLEQVSNIDATFGWKEDD
jgi:hypothetical protein